MATSKPSAKYANDEQRWQAVVARDVIADGQFVYAVPSTGVYCKPSCAARLPKRENVAFYLGCAEAEEAGFRACKRCRPNAPDLSVRQRDVIERVCRLIESNEETLSLDALAQQAAMSRFHFLRTFKKIVGITPKQFQQALRTQRLQQSLRHGESITEVIYAAGYGSSGHFYADADKVLGMQPRTMQRGGAGISIHHGVVPSVLGLVLVAATDKGICRIELGDFAQELTNALQRDFPHAQLLPMNTQLEAWLREIVRFIEYPQHALQLPLDIQGTAFQRQVWQALRDIPLGATASYTEIAARIGKPNAVRAVATACASNQLALAIPCHRVIRSNGELAGYRWGIERKRELLRREAKQHKAPKNHPA
ncbi:MAG TPA: bifunctional DNA-binding transcriptional regulator/O6-methylguanine-DNA methyltransferase Ada [Spongiibacteraceae bacterium]|nr:bifunctional DNA-binding transcriptional regulator/O6-methylguanine-DNA methyltransferase Ada [Spongiibacteraceae bacterium]